MIVLRIVHMGIGLNSLQYGVLYLGSYYNTGPYIHFPHFGNSNLGKLPHAIVALRELGSLACLATRGTGLFVLKDFSSLATLEILGRRVLHNIERNSNSCFRQKTYVVND